MVYLRRTDSIQWQPVWIMVFLLLQLLRLSAFFWLWTVKWQCWLYWLYTIEVEPSKTVIFFWTGNEKKNEKKGQWLKKWTTLKFKWKVKFMRRTFCGFGLFRNEGKAVFRFRLAFIESKRKKESLFHRFWLFGRFYELNLIPNAIEIYTFIATKNYRNNYSFSSLLDIYSTSALSCFTNKIKWELICLLACQGDGAALV